MPFADRLSIKVTAEHAIVTPRTSLRNIRRRTACI